MKISNSKLLFILNFVIGSLLYAFLSKDFSYYSNDRFNLLLVLFRIVLFSLVFSIFFLYLYLFKNTPHLKRQILTNLFVIIFSFALVYFFIDEFSPYLAQGFQSLAGLWLLVYIPVFFLIINFVNNIFISQNKELKKTNKKLSTALIVIGIFSVLLWTNSFVKAIDYSNLSDIPGRTGYSLTYTQTIEKCNELTLENNRQTCLMETRANAGIDCELIDPQLDVYSYYQNNCLIKKSLNNKDLDGCDSISSIGQKEECMIAVISAGEDWSNLNIEYCEVFSLDDKKIQCVLAIAERKKDPSLCKSLESATQINSCLYTLGVWSEMEYACDLIADNEKKSICHEHAKEQQKIRENK